MNKQFVRVRQRIKHRLGHAVMQHALEPDTLVRVKVVRTRHEVGDTSLNALNTVQATTPGDVRGLGRPGRLCAQAGNDQKQVPVAQLTAEFTMQQILQAGDILSTQACFRLHQVNKMRFELSFKAGNTGQAPNKLSFAKIR